MKKIQEVTDDQWLQVNEFNRFIYDDYFLNNVELSKQTFKSYKSNLKIWFRWVLENLNNKNELTTMQKEYNSLREQKIADGANYYTIRDIFDKELQN